MHTYHDVDNKQHMEYIATYVDDLIVASKHNADSIFDALSRIYLTRDETDLNSYLGQDIHKLPDSCYRISSETYIQEMVKCLEAETGQLRLWRTPMLQGDRPEEDESELLDERDTTHYQSLLGKLNWIVTTVRYDISYAVVSLARFSAAPRRGHLKRLHRIAGYLKKYPDISLVMDPTPIQLDGTQSFVWSKDDLEQYSEINDDVVKTRIYPDPIISELNVTIFVDSDHAHDRITGKSVTGYLVFLGSSPIEWKSKRQIFMDWWMP